MPYCRECHENLTMHADGTVACSCAVSQPGCEVDPAWRNDNGDIMGQWTLEEWRRQECESQERFA